MDFGGFGAGRIAVGARALPTTTGGRRGSSADARKGSKGKGMTKKGGGLGPSSSSPLNTRAPPTTSGGRQRSGSDGNASCSKSTKIHRFGLAAPLPRPEPRLPPPVVGSAQPKPAFWNQTPKPPIKIHLYRITAWESENLKTIVSIKSNPIGWSPEYHVSGIQKDLFVQAM